MAWSSIAKSTCPLDWGLFLKGIFMENIVIKLLDNWHYLIVLFFISQFLKIGLNSYLKVIEIKTLNKDFVRLEINLDSQVLEIRSNKVNLTDIEKISNKNKNLVLLENFKKESA
jgi:hypothetical protein